MARLALVFVGGGLGACARALLQTWLGSSSPLPILIANLLGAFLIGVVFVLADEAELLRAGSRLFLAVGMLGGFTTFSAFAWGADSFLARAETATAVAYVLSSGVGGILANLVGLSLGRELVVGLERAAQTILSRLESGRGGGAHTTVEGVNRHGEA